MKMNVESMWSFAGLEDGRLVNWNNNIYITGVRRDTTDYGQGRMMIETMFNLLQKIIDKRGNQLIGLDVCGEPVLGFHGAAKHIKVGDIGTQRYNEYMKPFLKPHSEINDRLCEMFEKFTKN